MKYRSEAARYLIERVVGGLAGFCGSVLGFFFTPTGKLEVPERARLNGRFVTQIRSVVSSR